MDDKQQDNHISNLLPSGRTGGGYRIALFGGTFDPIHNAHIALAESCREQLEVDEVWFLVTPQNPWKQGCHLSADEHRLRMVQLAIEGHSGLVASDYEFHLEKPTYSYLTLRHLREDYPEHEFILLIGGDNWEQFDHWSHYEEILQHHTIAVYPRTQGTNNQIKENSDCSLLPTNNLFHIKAKLLPISSTSIRQRVAKHKPIDAFVSPYVKDYILNNHLYEEEMA